MVGLKMDVQAIKCRWEDCYFTAIFLRPYYIEKLLGSYDSNFFAT